MIREEYNFPDISEYLIKTNKLLIAGFPTEEERSQYFPELWIRHNKDVLLLKELDNGTVFFRFYSNGTQLCNQADLCVGLANILKLINVSQKSVLLDLASLSHVLIMCVTKQLILNVRPESLFASYIRPQEYCAQSENVGYSLCEKVNGIESVPGFSKRNNASQKLCAFLGFDGVRLKSILESVQDITTIIPVVAFPSSAPQWYNVTMQNNIDILNDDSNGFIIHKCFSESIFEAVHLLYNNVNQGEKVILAPLGTRPHSMACAIFASQNSNVQIIYDHVVENNHRAKGIGNITIYHLSTFIKP